MAATVVLVHGAWQTAATWDLVLPELVREGRRVVAVTLTGLEHDGAPLTPNVSLDTHVDDLVRLLDAEDLRNATLVGHSYAGMIITGAVERSSRGSPG